MGRSLIVIGFNLQNFIFNFNFIQVIRFQKELRPELKLFVFFFSVYPEQKPTQKIIQMYSHLSAKLFFIFEDELNTNWVSESQYKIICLLILAYPVLEYLQLYSVTAVCMILLFNEERSAGLFSNMHFHLLIFHFNM